MFLKSLKIECDGQTIREILFHKGINLIIDETKTTDKRESGNSVGKTTVLRLIDFSLGGDGKNIYQDTEFKNKSNRIVEDFLKNNNVLVTLVLRENLEDEVSEKIAIERNFLSYGDKIQKINGDSYSNDDFPRKLKEIIFKSTADKPSFRQIIAKNIRDEKNKLVNTIKVLHHNVTAEAYEALYLFWLGIDLDTADRKQRLLAEKKIEENLQKRLKKESSLSQINQSLLVINRTIRNLETKKDSFNLNDNYNQDLSVLNQIKSEINTLATEETRLETRRLLILESKEDLEKDRAEIDTERIKKLYNEAKSLIPAIQKTFEQTLHFHNQMIKEKVEYITQELPVLNSELAGIRARKDNLLRQEKSLTELLRKMVAESEFQETISELNRLYEQKGHYEEQKSFWERSNSKLESIAGELAAINEGISSKEELMISRIGEFNKYFAEISNRLYGEQFVLSSDKNERGYELNIGSISGNVGTGKKKGEMAAFDLAYIQFADALDIPCLHFILQDQIENVHDNQITSLLTEIVSQINCQYVLPILRDKLPTDIDAHQFEILSLSQSDKLFRIEQ
jgi:uncharacterized protein YydD (DUF2326 family)